MAGFNESMFLTNIMDEIVPTQSASVLRSLVVVPGGKGDVGGRQSGFVRKFGDVHAADSLGAKVVNEKLKGKYPPLQFVNWLA